MYHRLFMREVSIRKGNKNPKDDLFIPNLVIFLIKIIIRGDMDHCRISPMKSTYIMHILTYINKYAGHELGAKSGVAPLKGGRWEGSRDTEGDG